MRSQILSVIAGTVAFAAQAASAPAPQQYGADTCAPNPTTVFVTAPVSVSTVTIHDAPTSTVYLTVPSYAVVQVSERPTATLTRLSTSTLTSTATTDISTIYGISPPAPSINGGAATSSSAITYKATVTETAIVETVYITVGQAAASSSTSSSTSVGPLSFMVANGTTYWAGGVAPPSTQSLIIVTSAVTVVPVITPLSGSETPTSTSTFTDRTTIFQTHQYTTTETRSKPNTTATVVSMLVSAGTGGPFTGVASGGWNATSYAWSYPTGGSKAIATLSNSEVSFVTAEPSFNIYTTLSPISLTASAAQSGFDAFTSSAASPSSTPNAFGTTAVISGQTTPWGGASYTNSSIVPTASFTENSGPPYANSTAAALPGTTSSVVGAVLSTGGYSYPWAPATNTSSVLGVAVSSSTSASYGGYYSWTGVAVSSSTSASYGGYYSWTGVASSGSALSSSTLTAGGFNSSTSTAAGIAISSSPVIKISSSTPGMAASPFNTGSTTFGLTTSSALGAATSETNSASPTYAPVSSSSSSSSASSNFTLSTSTSSIAAAYSPGSITASSQIPTSALPSASATPSTCGEVGNFCLNFDDIPPLSIGNQSANDVQPEPVFNPYHQFDFSDGFVVVPPPTDPYLPSSKPLLVEFIPNFNLNGTNTQSGPNTQEFGYSGDIGNGDHGLTGCFGFNFYGASFGCDSRGPDCDFTFTGFKVDLTTQQSNQIAQETYAVPACPALQNCSLVPVTFTNEFMDLDSIRINVTVAGAPKIWWMDDLNLGWYNNSCTTGLCRINTHIH